MISVVVVNWNGYEHLDLCLTALTNQTYTPKEIILVDNGSNDASVDFVRKSFPEVKVIALGINLGFCGGNNVGIQSATGEFVALINNDTEADPAWLAESIKALEEHPEAGFTASRIRLFDARTHLDTVGDLYFRSGYPGKHGWLMPDGPEFDREQWVFGACAGAVVYRRSMLEEIGLFDEDFFAYMEDIDLSFRAQLMGYQCLYVPTAIVYHKVGATAGRDSRNHQYWSHRNHWYVLIKNLPSSLWYRYLPNILGAEVLVLITAARKRRLQIFWDARVEVWRMLPKTLQKRRAIQKRLRTSADYIDSLVRKNWVSFRRATKRREMDFGNQTNG